MLEQIMPFEYDNLTFDASYLSHNGGSSQFSLSAYWKYFLEVRQNDNARLANILAIVPTLFLNAKIWFSMTVGIAVAGMTAMASKLATHKVANPLAISLFWIVFTILLPWRNNILNGDYALNYIFAGALALTFIAQFVSTRCKAATLISAVLLGAWHEGFALPVAAGIAMWLIIHPKEINRRNVSTFLVLTVVALAVFICPGMLNRSSAELGSNAAILAMPTKFIICNISTVALIATIIVLAAKHRLRALMQNKGFVVLTTASICACLLSAVVNFSGRASFAATLFAIVSLGIILRPYCAKINSKIKATTAVLASALCVVHGAWAYHWQYKFYDQFNEVMKRIEQAPGTTIFYDIIMPEEVPVTTLYFPSRATFVETYTYKALENYLAVSHTVVVPTSLATTSPSDTRLDDGIKRTDDAIYADVSLLNNDYGMATAEATLTNGTTLPAVQLFYHLYTDKKGYQHYYLKPYNLKATEITQLRIK
jgi:hypothetical protein